MRDNIELPLKVTKSTFLNGMVVIVYDIFDIDRVSLILT